MKLHVYHLGGVKYLFVKYLLTFGASYVCINDVMEHEEGRWQKGQRKVLGEKIDCDIKEKSSRGAVIVKHVTRCLTMEQKPSEGLTPPGLFS